MKIMLDTDAFMPTMTDNNIIKAMECCIHTNGQGCKDCPLKEMNSAVCLTKVFRNALALINRQKAEIERLNVELELKCDSCENIRLSREEYRKAISQAKSEAYKEFAEKITEIFLGYAHLHDYAEGARKDYIEAVDGTEIEMQSVWDVFTLKKNEMAEYEEMGRLQGNIETIAKERLLTELEKDFRSLVKELTESKKRF